MEENFSMEDFAAMLDQSFHKVYNGDIVEGKIIEKDEKGTHGGCGLLYGRSFAGGGAPL